MTEIEIPEGFVLISEDELDALKDDKLWRICVEDAGVDNWDGYSYAMEVYREESDDY